MKYDIFYSYRRSKGGKEVAIAIVTELEKLGYRVFLDLNNIVDDNWKEKIAEAISNSVVFIVQLTEDALDRCANEEDMVRFEIIEALHQDKHIVPVNPDARFKAIPVNIPNEIATVIKDTQHSDIMIGSLFKVSVKKMAEERIARFIVKPFIVRHLKSIALCVTLLIVSLATFFEISIRADARRNLSDYKNILSSASRIINNRDSLIYVDELLRKADSIYSKNTRSEYFLNNSKELQQSHQKFYEDRAIYYQNQYLKSHSHDDIVNCRKMLEKAYAVSPDPKIKEKINALNSIN